MSLRVPTLWAVIASYLVSLTGCHPTQPLYFKEDGDLSHYVDVATDIDYPDTKTVGLAEVDGALAPLTLENPKPHEMWDLKLETAIQYTLANSKVMRTLGGRFGATAQLQPTLGQAAESVQTRPDSVTTIYDPSIVETAPFVGVEAALGAFDAQFASNLFWEKNDRPQNVESGIAQNFFVRSFRQDTSTFNQQISKVAADGSQFTIRNNIVYDANNNPTRQIYSDWNTNIEASFAHPLLAGSGVQFNRIAGPQSPFTGTGTPTFDGVMLARINTDISLADFEAGVRNLVADAENAYWDLYFDYRNLEATKAGRRSALETWKKVHALYLAGSKGGEAEKEAQAREQYFFFRSQLQTALNNLYREENRLRYVMGLSVSDGRLIRPIDEPTTAKVTFEWHEIHAEGLCRAVELRRQKWRIKQRELELIAARNLLQPRLDLVGRYRWLGLGDDLLSSNNPAVTNGLDGTNSFSSLLSGNYQEWQFGGQFQMPIGFRRELSTVRHFQLQLARERARYQDQELELSHELGDAIRSLEGNYTLAVSNFNRRVAAERQVQAVQVAFDADTVTLDLLLDAQRRRADAEIAYYRSVVDYNRSISQVHFRKGSLLEYDGVYLAEGPWPAKAQFDAHRLARQRDASYYLDYGYTRPSVISQGAYKQESGLSSPGETGTSGTPSGEVVPHGSTTPEEMPTPKSSRPNPELHGEEMPTAQGFQRGPSLRQPKLGAAKGRGGNEIWGNFGRSSNDAAAGETSAVAKNTNKVEKGVRPADRGVQHAAATEADPESTSTQVSAKGLATTRATAKHGVKTEQQVIESKRAKLKQPRRESDEPAKKTARASNADKSQAADASGSELRTQRANYQEWKAAVQNESVENSPTGAIDRSAAVWKGAKR